MKFTVYLKQWRRGSIVIEAENDLCASEEALKYQEFSPKHLNWDPEFETEVLDVEESEDA